MYLRFQPHLANSAHGKRHINTVPVKLIRAYNTQRKPHVDSHFAAATVRFLKDLAVTFGNDAVFCLSQDDKARVPLGLPAAQKQGPILMKLDYKVKLPDHDWVIAARHKFIPSVYAALDIRKSSVSYSGPTYIAIRSGKHSSSTAFTHALDIERLLQLPAFAPFCHKPIWIFFVDGGPDENPRFPKTLQFASQHFKNNNLDGLFIATHAPHQSASNPVERRMAPLSRDLCGVILPHDTYGSHLDGSGRTIDYDLEVKNFKKAGEVLAEIWSQRIIDGYEVEAEYISPSGGAGSNGTDSAPRGYISEHAPDFLTEEWKSAHVLQSQYLLQIVKCNNLQCCGQSTTNLKSFFHGQFLPTPAKFIQTKEGVKLSDDMDRGVFMDLQTRLSFSFLLRSNLQFDAYCPSVNSKLKERTCTLCLKYFVTKKALLSHKKLHSANTPVLPAIETLEFHDDEPDNMMEAPIESTSPNIFQITNMASWLQQLFEDITE